VTPFSRVLCPIDFSDTSERALLYATALARWHHAELTVLHIASAPAIAPLGGGPGEAIQMTGLIERDEVIAEMKRALERSGAAALNPVVATEEGPAARVIAKHAAAMPADLLVLGTHGRTGFSRLLLGSVTEKVLRTVTCPVLTVPPSASAGPAAPVAFERVLCAIDFSPASLAGWKLALAFGRQSGGSVTALHALEYMDPHEPCEHVDADIRRHREHVLDHARERLQALVAAHPDAGCTIEAVVAVNRAYREILQRAAASATDLIVMGAQGTDGLELMLYGSNTQHVVRGSTCPVLTVHA
jgi:nucleotide-binding universal stress UspA family protein